MSTTNLISSKMTRLYGSWKLRAGLVAALGLIIISLAVALGSADQAVYKTTGSTQSSDDAGNSLNNSSHQSYLAPLTPNNNSEDQNQSSSQTNLSVQTGSSPKSNTNNQSQTKIDINGQTTVIPEGGSVSKSFKSKDGKTDVKVFVDDNSSNTSGTSSTFIEINSKSYSTGGNLSDDERRQINRR